MQGRARESEQQKENKRDLGKGGDNSKYIVNIQFSVYIFFKKSNLEKEKGDLDLLFFKVKILACRGLIDHRV